MLAELLAVGLLRANLAAGLATLAVMGLRNLTARCGGGTPPSASGARFQSRLWPACSPDPSSWDDLRLCRGPSPPRWTASLRS